MNKFPILSTGAVTQYPMVASVTCPVRVLRCIDGREQRFRTNTRPVRRWTIRLDLLDELEAVQLEAFFEAQGGRLGVFEFVDPADGKTYPHCSLEQDECRVEFKEENRASAVLMVKENWS
jgi:hypothetical protein